MSRFAALLVGALLVCLTTSCTWWGATRIKGKDLRGVRTTYSTADLRAVNYYEFTDKQTGSVQPKKIVCAEPSPDVAKAMSEAIGTSLSAKGKGTPGGAPTPIEASLAGAFSTSNAEALAQLTQRLATIQLLRDAMYRACEAYANGAISDTTYTLLVSQYGETVSTLLLAELAGSNQWGKLATLSMKSESKTSTRGGEDGTPQASADTSAETADSQSVEIGAQASSGEIARALHEMQKSYLDRDRKEAFETACVTALDRADRPDSVFGLVCLKLLAPELYKPEYGPALFRHWLRPASDEAEDATAAD